MSGDESTGNDARVQMRQMMAEAEAAAREGS